MHPYVDDTANRSRAETNAMNAQALCAVLCEKLIVDGVQRTGVANLLGQVSDLGVLGLGLGLLSEELRAEVVLVAQEAFACLLQEVLLLLQLAQLHSKLCLHISELVASWCRS